MVILAAVAVFYAMTLAFPPESAMYPKGILGFIAINAIFLLLRPQNVTKLVSSMFSQWLKDYKIVALIIIATTAFIGLMESAGIYTILPLFVGGIMYILGVRDLKRLVLIPVLITIIVYIIFTLILKVPVPMGIFE